MLNRFSIVRSSHIGCSGFFLVPYNSTFNLFVSQKKCIFATNYCFNCKCLRYFVASVCEKDTSLLCSDMSRKRKVLSGYGARDAGKKSSSRCTKEQPAHDTRILITKERIAQGNSEKLLTETYEEPRADCRDAVGFFLFVWVAKLYL